MPGLEDLMDPAEQVQLKRCIQVKMEKVSSLSLFFPGNRECLQRGCLPPICTHNMVDTENDPVLCALRRCQLFNNDHDRVKVSYPCFLSIS